MKVTDDEARASFQKMLDDTDDAGLEAILDDLHTMQSDPRINQRNLQVLIGVFYAEVNKRIREAAEQLAAMNEAAFQVKH